MTLIEFTAFSDGCLAAKLTRAKAAIVAILALSGVFLFTIRSYLKYGG